jgi:hypothetical protein
VDPAGAPSGTETDAMILATLLLASSLHVSAERAVSPPLRNGSPYNQVMVDVTAAGDVALLTWEEEGGRAAVRIDRDGRFLDEEPIVLTRTRFTNAPRAARGPDRWLLVWVGPEGRSISGAFLRDDGALVFEPFTLVHDTMTGNVSVAFDGTHYLVAWSEVNVVEAIRLNAHGQVVESGIQLPGLGEVNVVALEGGGFAVAGVSIRVLDNGVREWSVEQFRLDTNADVLSHAILDRTSTTFFLSGLHVLADGNALVAVWSDAGGRLFVAREGEPLRVIATGATSSGIVEVSGSVYVAALTNGETVLISEDGATRCTVGTGTTWASAASFGDRAIAGMLVHHDDEFDLSIAVVDAALQDVLPQTRVELGPPLQERPAVARNAQGEALTVWMESGRREGPAVMGRLLDAAGRPTGNAFVVGAVQRRAEVRPHVASDGTDFLVAWYDLGVGSDAHGTRTVHVRRDGTVSAPVRHLLAATQLCLAWNGTDYLLGHLREAVNPPSFVSEVGATRLSRDGVQQGPTLVLTPEMERFSHFSCAASESATLFVFESADTGVRGVIVGHGGTPTAPFSIGENGGFPQRPVRTAVAANGHTFLAAWTTNLDSIRWALVSEQGTASLVPEELVIESNAHNIAAAPYREGFLLAWQGGGNVLGLALDAAGRSAANAPISLLPQFEHEVGLAGGDRVTAVYQRDLESGLGARWRVFTRTMTEAAPRTRAVRH